MLSQIKIIFLVVFLGAASLLAQETNGGTVSPAKGTLGNSTPMPSSPDEKTSKDTPPAVLSLSRSQDNNRLSDTTFSASQDINKPPGSIANIAQDQYSIIESKFIDVWNSPMAPTEDTTSYRYQEWFQIRALIRGHQTLDPFNTNPFDPHSIFFEVSSEIKCQELPIFEKLGIPLATFNANPLFPDCVERKLTEGEFASFSNLKAYLSDCSGDSLLSQAAFFVEIEYIMLLLEKRESHLDLYQQIALNIFEASFLEPLQVDTSYFALMNLQGEMICWENICKESKCEDAKSDNSKSNDSSSRERQDKADKKSAPASSKKGK